MIEKTISNALSELSIPSYPLVIPQDQPLPAIDYFRMKTNPTNTIGGTSRTLDNGIFQLDVWAGTYFGAKELAEAVIDKLIEVFGKNALLLDNRDDYEAGIYHVILQFSLREKRG
jgi:hypothetical protein